ncbi:hypothetical protein DFJ74DRAFT_657877 [Hyaloraphidium curvatum]|nr:hypothetical protein DFJ74DRAFT_657877 [Hyaloraphidium curvatum]
MFLDGQPWHTSPEAPVRGGSHLPVIGPLKPGNYSGEMVLNAEAYASGVQQTVTGYVKLELDADKAVLLYQAVPPQVWTQSYIVDNLGLAISCAPMRHVDFTYDEELSRCAAPSPVYRLDTTRGSSQPFPQCGDAGYYITAFAHQWLSQPSQITPGANCAIPGCPV